MRIKRILVSSLGALALALPAAASADNGLLNVTGNQIAANAPICANVLSSGACATTGNQTANNSAGSSQNNGLVNVAGNQVGVNAPVCANVIASGNCTASGTQNATNSGVTTGTSGGVLGTGVLGNNGLVNVSGNQVGVNLPVCANVLSSGNCTTSGTQVINNPPTNTPPTTCTTNCGGGVLGDATDGPFASVLGASDGLGGGTLPQTGSLGWLALVFSVFGSIATGAVAARRKLA